MNTNNHTTAISGRLISLDALRGFDMFWIIGGGAIFKGLAKGTNSEFLNNLLPQFDHVQWAGFHFYDLIWPLFLFMVGVAMTFSFKKRLARGDSKRQLYFHIIKRVVILWILGMVAQCNLLTYDLSKLWIYYNALQTIAAGYLIASIVMLNMEIRWQMITTAGLTLLYWALMTFVPVPDYGAGVFTPNGNLAHYLEKLIQGPLYHGTSDANTMASLNFGCAVMLGVMAGHLLHSERSQRAKVIWLLGGGVGCLTVGLTWSNWFPLILRIYTSSFTLFTAGLSYLLFALFYLVIDVWGLRKWAFGFVVIGRNSIAVYMVTRLFDFRQVGNIFVGGLAKWLGDWNDFVQAVAAFAVIWLILYWMYRKRSFVKI